MNPYKIFIQLFQHTSKVSTKFRQSNNLRFLQLLLHPVNHASKEFYPTAISPRHRHVVATASMSNQSNQYHLAHKRSLLQSLEKYLNSF